MEGWEIERLWTRFHDQGDTRARAALIEHYTHLVRITAGRVAAGAAGKADREDLFGAGAVGLIRAVDQWDPTRGVKFETLAISLIRGTILEYLRGQDWASRGTRDRIKLVEAAVDHLLSVEKVTATPEAVAEYLGCDVDEVFGILKDRDHVYPTSLDTFVRRGAVSGSGDDKLTRLGETVPDHDSPTPHALALQGAQRDALLNAIASLPEREREIVSLYFYEGLTFKEIAGIYKVSESRVFQLQSRALGRIKTKLGDQVSLFESD